MAISSTDPLAGPAPVVAVPKPPPPRGRLVSDIVRHRTDYLWVAPALLVMVLVIGYPFAYTIDLSFYDTPPSSPNWYFNGVNNYAQILTDPNFWAITVNTLYWAVGSTVLAFLIGLGAALVIQREFIGRSLVRGLLMIPYVISYVAAAYVWRWLYHSDYGLISGVLYESYLIDSPINFLDSTSMVMPSLIVANVWKEFPFAMIVLLWIMTGGGPANASQIWITQVYTLAFQSLQYGRASSYSVILFIVMLSLGYFYVRALTGGGRRREARG